MDIIYHHYKDPIKEENDRIQNWWTCPPELSCTKEEEDRLRYLWHKYTGENNYITDPLGHKQCLYIMLKQLPWFIHLFTKWSPKRINKIHLYDLIDQI